MQKKTIILSALAMLLCAPAVLFAQQTKKNPSPNTGVTIAAPRNITGNDLKETLTCSGEAVTITGNDNKITIEGTCSRITLTGNDNKISMGKVEVIKVMGNDNKVLYTDSDDKGGKAKVSSTGSDNKIDQRKPW